MLLALSAEVPAQWMDISSDRKDIKFADDKGFMVGAHGTLLVSEDAGKNWKNLATPIPSNYSCDYVEVFKGGQSIKILGNRNIQDGWVSYRSLLISSDDGGKTWRQDFSFNGDNLNGYFLNDSVGWLMVNSTASSSPGKKTWKTVDGGLHWTEDTTLANAYKLFFHNPLQGWAFVFTNERSNFFKTNDGGNTWQESHRLDLAMPRIYNGWSFFVTDENEAWIGGYNSNALTSRLYHTKNGGETWSEETWQQANNPSGYNVTNINFIDSQTGFLISSEEQNLYKTNDNGQTWQLVLTSTDWYQQRFKKVVFLNNLDGFVIGTRGFYASTNDGGDTWQIENHCSAGNNFGIVDIKIEDNRQWVVCDDLVLRSDDGTTWSEKTPNSVSDQITSIDFVGNNGILVGPGYKSTSDNGDTWQSSVPNFGYPTGFSYEDMKVYYRSPASIWLTGVNGYIFKSTDGGTTFTTSKKGPASQFQLAFQSSDIVWAFDDTGTYNTFLSTNGGESWTNTNQKTTTIFFLNESLGWKLLSNKELYKTTDGGTTWNYYSTLTFMLVATSPKLEFVDETKGWLLTRPNKIYFTNDGGLTWSDNKSDVPYPVTSLMVSNGSNGVIGLAGGSKLLKYVGEFRAHPVVNLTSPSDLVLLNINNTQIGLNWSDNSNNEEGFIIQYRNSNGVFQTIDTVGANVNTISYPINILTKDVFTYRIGAFIQDQITVFGQPTTANFLLPAPQNLSIVEVTESSLQLSWEYSFAAENFVIERSLDSLSFSQVSLVASNTVSYVDIGLNQDTKYYYRIKAISSGNKSAYSSVSGFTHQQAAPQSPSNLQITALASSLKLTWDDNSTNELGFIIERSDAGKSFDVLDSVAANGSEYVDADILENILYSYQVKAFREYSVSDYIQSEGILIVTHAEEGIPKIAFVLFPNPTDGIVTISSMDANIYQIVYDLKGHELRSYGAVSAEDNIQIDISDLPVGLYMIRIQSDQLHVSRKILRK